MVDLSEKSCPTPPSEAGAYIHGVWGMKNYRFPLSLSRSHPAPPIGWPAMSNSRQSRPLPFMEASEGFGFLVFPESASGVPCGLVGEA